MTTAVRPFTGSFTADPDHSSFQAQLRHMGVGTFRTGFEDVQPGSSPTDGPRLTGRARVAVDHDQAAGRVPRARRRWRGLLRRRAATPRSLCLHAARPRRGRHRRARRCADDARRRAPRRRHAARTSPRSRISTAGAGRARSRRRHRPPRLGLRLPGAAAGAAATCSRGTVALSVHLELVARREPHAPPGDLRQPARGFAQHRAAARRRRAPAPPARPRCWTALIDIPPTTRTTTSTRPHGSPSCAPRSPTPTPCCSPRPSTTRRCRGS